MPFLFDIENQLKSSILTWTKISEEDKNQQIFRISMFKQMLESNTLTNNADHTKRKKLVSIIKKYASQKQESKDVQVN